MWEGGKCQICCTESACVNNEVAASGAVVVNYALDHSFPQGIKKSCSPRWDSNPCHSAIRREFYVVILWWPINEILIGLLIYA